MIISTKKEQKKTHNLAFRLTVIVIVVCDEKFVLTFQLVVVLPDAQKLNVAFF